MLIKKYCFKAKTFCTLLMDFCFEMQSSFVAKKNFSYRSSSNEAREVALRGFRTKIWEIFRRETNTSLSVRGFCFFVGARSNATSRGASEASRSRRNAECVEEAQPRARRRERVNEVNERTTSSERLP